MHEPYIRDCLEGLLMQATTFPVQLLIHDDASTDGTARVLLEYKARYPDLITVIQQSENQFSQGRMALIRRTLNDKTDGYYTAFCEGDDYWVAPDKLQRQVDFLEQNSDYAMVATDIILVDEKGGQIVDNDMLLKKRELHKPGLVFHDLLHINFINTLTVCLRSKLLISLTKEAEERDIWYAIDQWFWLNIALYHKIRLFNDITAAYRIHSSGISRDRDFIARRVHYARYDTVKKYLLINNRILLAKEEKKKLTESIAMLMLSPWLLTSQKALLLGKMLKHPGLATLIFGKIFSRGVIKLSNIFNGRRYNN